MKPPFFFLSSLVIFVLLSLAYTDEQPIEGDEHPPMNCFPTNCGNVTDITYPFWVENKQPSHCGYPAFMLTCIDHIPMLQMSSEKYHVKKIFYENQSLVLADAKFINNQCPVQYSKISFNLTPFSVCSINKQLTFLFNCSETLPSYFEVDCAAGKSNLTFAHFGDQLGFWSSCVTAVMPVLDYWGVGVEDYRRLLENGFLVNWTVADCTDCLQSRGQCGYNNVSENFMCICHDRAHSRQCHSGNTASSISSSSIVKNFLSFFLP